MNNQNVSAPFVDETFAKMASDNGMFMRQLEKEVKEEGVDVSSPVETNFEGRMPQMFDLRQEEEGFNSSVNDQILSAEELQSVYNKSVQDGTREQTVRGELYVGKNPSLLRFTSSIREKLIPKLQRTLQQKAATPVAVDMNMEMTEGASLKPASIFDDELLETSEVSQVENESQNRGSK